MISKTPLAQCDKCPLRTHAFVPPSTPSESCSMAVVGEAPGRTEVIKGESFIGPSGELLFGALNAVGIYRESLHVTNVVLCFPGSSGVPAAAIRCCTARLEAELKNAQITHILALGAVAKRVLTGDSSPILMSRGRWARSEMLDAWVLGTIHPAFVLRPPKKTGQTIGGPSKTGPALLFDIEKFSRLSPVPFVETSTILWHFPDAKTKSWVEPRFKERDRKQERSWVAHFALKRGLLTPKELHTMWTTPKYYRRVARVMVQEVVAHLDFLTKQELIAIDLETTGYSPFEDRILSISFSWQEGKASVISGALIWQKSVHTALKKLFEAPNIQWVGHNAKFDAKFLTHCLGTSPEFTHDTSVLHCALDERSELKLHALKPLVSQYFDVADYEKEIISRYLPSRKTSFANIPAPLLAKYSGMDVDYTRRLLAVLWSELEHQPKVKQLYTSLMMPATRAFVSIELHGIQIDWDRIEEVRTFFEAKEQGVLEKLRKLSGHPELNPNSPKQVAIIIWDEMGLEEPASTKHSKLTKDRSTRKKVLQLLSEEHPENEFIRLMITIRRYRKLLSSYVKNVYKYADENGKVHPLFNLAGTEVGRLSAKNPAIQTIPRAYEATGKLVRDCYTASSGYVLVYADYSQAELRVAAILSKDEFLLGVYREGRDLHSEVALSMYGADYTPEERNICKMMNFAYLYGGTELSFAGGSETHATTGHITNINIEDARAWVRRYNKLMIGLMAWRDEQFKKMKAQGYVESLLGRRRRFPLILDSNKDEVRKSSIHAPIAGAASDLTLKALIKMHLDSPVDVFALLSIHDSNMMECPDDDQRILETANLMRDAMMGSAQEVFGDIIPFEVEIEVGHRWGSMVAYDDTPNWRGTDAL